MKIMHDDPRRQDIVDLLHAHLAFANEQSAPEDVHALEVDSLASPDIEFFAARQDSTLLGIGALRRIHDGHYEIKSMHTSAAARGRGIGRAMVEHLLSTARAQGASRVSLETGTAEAFAPARGLYRSFGFVDCDPFGDYFVSEASICMRLVINPLATS